MEHTMLREPKEPDWESARDAQQTVVLLKVRAAAFTLPSWSNAHHDTRVRGQDQVKCHVVRSPKRFGWLEPLKQNGFVIEHVRVPVTEACYKTPSVCALHFFDRADGPSRALMDSHGQQLHPWIAKYKLCVEPGLLLGCVWQFSAVFDHCAAVWSYTIGSL